MKKTIPYILLTTIITSCSMKNKAYQELHQHEGTENYEVATLIPKQNKATYMHFDTVQNHIIVDSYYDSAIEENSTYESIKFNYLGDVIEKFETDEILGDGTDIGFNYYSNWIINGDKTRHKFVDPFTNHVIEDTYNYEWPEKDFDKWFKVFRTLYDKANYVYIDISFYFLKVDGTWYLLDDTLEESPENFRKEYPAKENQDVRIGKLRDLCPDFSVNENNRDTSFMNVVDYEETDSEDGGWFNPISYSAGYYFIELYMPMGDTVKIKRHGSMGANLEVYKIPVTRGGRNDVVFLIQKPGKLYPEKEFGGMYVVRPRSLEQKEYGPHKSYADSYASQYDSVKGNIDVEAKFLKPMKD